MAFCDHLVKATADGCTKMKRRNILENQNSVQNLLQYINSEKRDPLFSMQTSRGGPGEQSDLKMIVQ